MKHLKSQRTAAVVLTAVVCLGLLTAGCVTKRDIDEVKDSLNSIRSQNAQTQRLVERMDSIITAGAQSNARLTTEIRTSVADLQQSIANLLQNYNDLIQRIDALTRVKPKVTVESSPGAQDTAPAQKSQTDCMALYDDAFILVRGSKYDQAISSFKSFLEACPQNENAANAHYWIGDCLYTQEKYTAAVDEFDLVLKNYTETTVVVKALYKLARAKQELGKKDEARKYYKKIVAEHKGTLEARQAEERLKELK
ncbi:MAG: tol-pal system protein YbgF [candidate division Zixibacteria bacterium]|nr:tol-pal system protein YbgF [candidate division Zixibacteria bacterium]